jgi:hypothetical protein
MNLLDTTRGDPPYDTLPPRGRLFTCAVLVPAVVAISNQVLLGNLSGIHELRLVLYVWMAASIAVLSWCAGHYLSPTWLRWIVFAWCLALMDLLTFIACIDGRLEDQYGYVLVSAEIALLMLWAILGPGAWQIRLPAVAAAAPLVVMFSGSFVGWRGSYTRTWGVMMMLMTLIVAMLCGGLRYLGFSLQMLSPTGADGLESGKRRVYQFGTKHMLIWLTVTGPLLLLIRNMDFGFRGLFPGTLLALSVATVNLLAIWAVLGGGHWLLRVGSLLGIPFLIAQGMMHYSAHLKASAGNLRWYQMYGTTAWMIGEMEDLWLAWLWLDAALLAALLFFLRANGYRLIRKA